MDTTGAEGSDPLHTVAEVADRLRVSNMTVYRLIKSGDLPAVRVGKNFRIRASDLAAFLDASRTGQERAGGQHG